MPVIIFKAIEKCNSNCIYCDVIKKHQNVIMDYELLEIFIKKVNIYLEENIHKDIDITWHGGEICLLSSKFFYKCYEFIEKYCKNTKSRITHSVQSNLTLINQEIVTALKVLGIQYIGTSYDIIKGIRGFGHERDSVAYNKKFLEGISLLNENKISWGIIYVVHRYSLPFAEEIFHTLSNLNLSDAPQFNKIYVYGNDEHKLRISGIEYADFLGKIFPIWWNNRKRFNNVSPFFNITESIEKGLNFLNCENAGVCAHNWAYVGPDGDTSQCGTAGDYKIVSYGNIRDKSLTEILNNPNRQIIENRNYILPNEDCKDCRFWWLCKGGCPIDAYMNNKSMLKKASHCEWFKHFIINYFEPITGYIVKSIV